MSIPAKRGRKPKGHRAQITAKVPAEQKPLLEEAARKAGMPLCDYVAVVLAQFHGYAAPNYLDRPPERDEPFPISA